MGLVKVMHTEWLSDTVPSLLHIIYMHNYKHCDCIAVEIGFSMGAYTVSESDLNAVVCVQVTAGLLTPAETAIVTVSTLSGTAKGISLHNQYSYIILPNCHYS